MIQKLLRTFSEKLEANKIKKKYMDCINQKTCKLLMKSKRKTIYVCVGECRDFPVSAIYNNKGNKR